MNAIPHDRMTVNRKYDTEKNGTYHRVLIQVKWLKTTVSCRKTTECSVFTTISSCFYLHEDYAAE